MPVTVGSIDLSIDTSTPIENPGDQTYAGGEEHAEASSNGDLYHPDALGENPWDGVSVEPTTVIVHHESDPASSGGESTNSASTGFGALGLMLLGALNPPAAIGAAIGAGVAEGVVVVGENLPRIEDAGAAVIKQAAAELPVVEAEASAVGQMFSRFGSFISENGTALARWLGAQGESAVRAVNDIGPKTPIDVNGRMRIPDGLTPDVLSEVKNVAYQSYTLQLRDFANFAQQNQLQFNLYIRPDTSLSGPLFDAYQNGVLNILKIPFGQ